MLEENETWEQKRWCEAFDLADSIHADLLELEVPNKVRGLIDTVARPVAMPNVHKESVEARERREPIDREKRLAELRAQAREVDNQAP